MKENEITESKQINCTVPVFHRTNMVIHNCHGISVRKKCVVRRLMLAVCLQRNLHHQIIYVNLIIITGDCDFLRLAPYYLVTLACRVEWPCWISEGCNLAVKLQFYHIKGFLSQPKQVQVAGSLGLQHLSPVCGQ